MKFCFRVILSASRSSLLSCLHRGSAGSPRCGHEEYIEKILDLGRDGKKPRKDFICAKQIFEFISYFFDDHFVIEDSIPAEVSDEDAAEILRKYLETYDHNDDQSQWFDKICSSFLS